MRKYSYKHKSWFKCLLIGMTCMLILSNVAYSLDIQSSLSAPSGFDSKLSITKYNGLVIVRENNLAAKLFQSKAEFLLVSKLISKILTTYERKYINRNLLVKLIKLSLPGDLVSNNFQYEHLYENEKVFCLPYRYIENGRVIRRVVRYYLLTDIPKNLLVSLSTGLG